MKIKFKKLHPDAKLPTKSDGNIGWDLYYCGEDITLFPGERAVLETGIAWEPPAGLHGLLWDRSGLSVNNGLHRLGGVIDNHYRGQFLVCLVNINLDFKIDKNAVSPDIYIPIEIDGVPYTIKKGDKIAQLIIQQEVPTEVEWAEELSETERGEKGFGSSGR